MIFFYKNALIKLDKKYKNLTFFLIAIYLNNTKKIQIIIDTEESIPNDCKQPKNQYFWEFLSTAQNAVT